jgi:lipoprotein-releasing system permease protein
MPFELFLALRYLRMRRGRRVAKWTAAAAVAGIACGVAALIVALALARGFREELRDKILGGTAHVTLARAGGASAAELRAAAESARGVEGVRDAAPTTYAGALLNGPDGAAYAVLRGVDAGSPRAHEAARSTVSAGSFEPLLRTRAGESDEEPAPVVVGEELAVRTGLDEVGAEGWLVTGESVDGELSPRARRVRVAGLFRAGLHDYDAAWVYLGLAEALGAGGRASDAAVVSVEVRDLDAAGEVAARLRRTFGPEWTAVDWREANRALFAALELERKTVAVIIVLVMAVAALNITTTLALVVVERRADIAVLGALGARPGSLMTIFVIEGALVGLFGAALGVALGLAACAAGEHFELVRLPAEVYAITSVPFRTHWRDVLLPALAACVLSVLATLYPARQAARTRPAEALRYE